MGAPVTHGNGGAMTWFRNYASSQFAPPAVFGSTAMQTGNIAALGQRVALGRARRHADGRHVAREGALRFHRAVIARGLLLLAALLPACAGAESEVRVFAARPARPNGCKVDVFPGENHANGYEAESEVARAAVRCRKRQQCIDELKKQACLYGARGVYWSSEVIIEDGRTDIDAHLVVPIPRPAYRFWEGGSDGDVTW